MLNKKYPVVVLVFLIIILFPSIVFGEEKTKIQQIFSIGETNNTGLIFNINDLLLDIESYQGGLGVKYFYSDKIAYRGSLNFSYADILVH